MVIVITISEFFVIIIICRSQKIGALKKKIDHVVDSASSDGVASTAVQRLGKVASLFDCRRVLGKQNGKSASAALLDKTDTDVKHVHILALQRVETVDLERDVAVVDVEDVEGEVIYVGAGVKKFGADEEDVVLADASDAVR